MGTVEYLLCVGSEDIPRSQKKAKQTLSSVNLNELVTCGERCPFP